MADISQDNAALLPAGDIEKLDKHEREEFYAMQERMVQTLIQAANHYQSQFPSLRVEWRFQMDVYQTMKANPPTVRYSSRVY